MYKLEYLPEALKKYNKLDGSQKNLIDKSLKRIETTGMLAGKPLKGSLSSCRSLKHQKAGLRVVFTKSKDCIKIIDIISIGKRADLEVFKNAAERLKKK